MGLRLCGTRNRTGAALLVVLGVLSAGLCLFLGLITPAPVNGLTASILSSFQIPTGNDRARTCQGIAFDGTYLYLLETYDWNRAPKIMRFTTGGSFVNQGDAPGYYTWHSQKGFAYDGTYFWMTEEDGNAVIYNFLPDTQSIISSFATPNTRPRECERTGNNLWEVDCVTGWVYRLNTSGSVLSSFQITQGPDPTERFFGLAFDGTYLWVSKYGRNDALGCFTPGGGEVGWVPIPGGYRHPLGLAAEGSDLWFIDANTDTFVKVRILFQ